MNYSEAIACMGGACPRREGCARYHAPHPARDNPFERLCSRKSYAMWLERPVSIPVTAGTFKPFALEAA